MATQYSYENISSTAEFEYQAEELRKRMQYAKANFAYIKFKRAMQSRMSGIND